MAERKRRTLPEIFGIDEEYSKAIDAPHAQAIGPATAPVSKLVERPDQQSLLVPKRQIKEPSDDEAQSGTTETGLDRAPHQDLTEIEPPTEQSQRRVVRVRPAVRPLDRQEKEIAALGKVGYRREVILSLARKQTQKRFRLTTEYKPPEKTNLFSGKEVRLSILASRSDLDALSEQAGDLGTLLPAELIRSQVQPVWIEELDAVIAKLKGKQQ